MLRRILQEHGLELDRDYTFVPAGATGYRLESMEKGETFAGVLNPPWNARAEEAGMRLIARHSDVVPGYPGGVIAVSRPWGEANRGIVVGFLRALLDAARWTADPSRRNAAVALVAGASDLSEERAARALSDIPDPLRPDPETFAIPLEIRLRFGLTPPHGPDIASYLDHSYLEEAQA